MYTDIAFGRVGLSTVLVLSGEARLEEDLPAVPHQRDLVAQDLGDLYHRFRAVEGQG